jgi:hypothetical protein
MNPINKRLPILLPRVLPHLATPRVIEAAAAYCVGVRDRSIVTKGNIRGLPTLDFKVSQCLNWTFAPVSYYASCDAIVRGLELELNSHCETPTSPP